MTHYVCCIAGYPEERKECGILLSLYDHDIGETVALVNQIGELQIVPASLDDLEAILAIEQESFAVPWTRKAFEAELVGNEFSVTLVARKIISDESSTPIIAYLCVWVVFEELRFLTLAVNSAFRRQGIGFQLVSYALQLGISKGTRRALLEVRQSNEAAQALYEKFGFHRYGARKGYYTNPEEDAILMWLDPLSVHGE